MEIPVLFSPLPSALHWNPATSYVEALDLDTDDASWSFCQEPAPLPGVDEHVPSEDSSPGLWFSHAGVARSRDTLSVLSPTQIADREQNKVYHVATVT